MEIPESEQANLAEAAEIRRSKLFLSGLNGGGRNGRQNVI